MSPARFTLPFAFLALAPCSQRVSAGALEFNGDIHPIRSDNSLNCHGQDRGSRKGRLRLDDRAGAAAWPLPARK